MSTIPPYERNDNLSTPKTTEQNIADHPVLAEINATCANIERLEKELRLAKQQLDEDIKTLPSKIGDNRDLQNEVVHHLYWFSDRINLTMLKQVFKFATKGQTGKNTPNVIISAYIEVQCKTCQIPLQVEVKSRDEMTRKSGYSYTCTTCKALNDEVFRKENELYKARRQQYLYHLQTMPYYEYLKTPEWQETRKRAMKRAGFRCQVCNAYGVQLNVHHRTYDRRGCEDNRDLITLCRDCHQIFHENGQIEDGE